MAKKKPVAARTAKLAEWPFPVGNAKQTTAAAAKAPAKKKAEPKKMYMAVNGNNYAGDTANTVEGAYKELLDATNGDPSDHPVDECDFYEVKKVKVVGGVRLA